MAALTSRKHIARAGGVVLAFGLAAASLTACSGSGGNNNGGSGSTPKDVTFTTIDGNKSITPGAPMNVFNSSSNVFSGYDTQQLAYTKQNPTDINDMYPALAKSWELSSDGTKLTVHLDPKAGFSDGSKVTSKDVKTSFALGLATGTVSGVSVSSVDTPDDQTVVFTQAPAAVVSKTFQLNCLSTNVVPAAVFGKLVPEDVWTTISDSTGTDAAKAKDAKDKLAALAKTITTFAPDKDISAGPFAITAINPGEVVMAKNANFWAADKVSPTKVVLRNYSGNQEIWNYLQSGQLDYGPFTAMPNNIKDAIVGAGNKMVQSPSFVQASLAFNQTVKPFDKVEVRQAFAYLLNRTDITKVGQPVGGSPVEQQSGVVKRAYDQIATSDTTGKMVKYDNDKAKAEQLLQQAGLTKGSDGKWQLDGKPWSITLQTVTGFSDWIAGSNVVKDELTQFGIDCQVQVSPDFATYQKEMQAGKYPFGWWLVGVGTNPPASLGRIFGSGYGYAFAGGKVTYTDDPAKGNWLHGPQDIKIATGDTVKPGELTMQMNTQDFAAQKDAMQKIFLAENASLPVIGIWDYTNTVFVNEKRFSNFPDGSDAGLMRLPPGVWMSHGFIKAKSK